MKLTARQYAKALHDSLQDTAAKDHDTVLDNFANALAMNNDLGMFSHISEEYDRLEKESKRIKFAEATSASPLDKKTEQEIVAKLNGMVAGSVELKKKIDEKILGGVVIRLDDTLIDASVKNSLEELKSEIAE